MGSTHLLVCFASVIFSLAQMPLLAAMGHYETSPEAKLQEIEPPQPEEPKWRWASKSSVTFWEGFNS